MGFVAFTVATEFRMIFQLQTVTDSYLIYESI